MLCLPARGDSRVVAAHQSQQVMLLAESGSGIKKTDIGEPHQGDRRQEQGDGYLATRGTRTRLNASEDAQISLLKQLEVTLDARKSVCLKRMRGTGCAGENCS